MFKNKIIGDDRHFIEQTRFENCNIGNFCSFAKGCLFINCTFGNSNSFGEGCRFKTCTFGRKCVFADKCILGMLCRVGTHATFGNRCTVSGSRISCCSKFGKWCTFAAECRFNSGCTFGERCYFGKNTDFKGTVKFGERNFISRGSAFYSPEKVHFSGVFHTDEFVNIVVDGYPVAVRHVVVVNSGGVDKNAVMYFLENGNVYVTSCGRIMQAPARHTLADLMDLG